MNPILNTDSYKLSHFKQYPEGTENTYFYIESRGGLYDKTVFFGLQMFLKEYFNPITKAHIEEAKALAELHGLVFNEAGWLYILEKHKGVLPIRINALPEGVVVNTNNALLTIENTDPECYWLPAYLETALLRAIWYPTTVSTTSRNIMKAFRGYHEVSSDADIAELDFKLHDFGARGTSSYETTGIGGLAHLTVFKGTDTMPALLCGRKYYQSEMAGFSIPAAEHSTMTTWGRDGEEDAYQNMLEQFATPGATVAVVSDSYNIYHAVDKIWGQKLKAQVEQSGATIIVRPDSGDAATVPIEVIKRLMEVYGHTVNSKGYKVLPDCIRVIQGDGVDPRSIHQILANLNYEKIALDNITFGMGAALLQKVNRDTQRFAMKCSAAKVGGKWRDVFKDPITDHGKKSKAGRLAVVKSGNQYVTILESDLGDQTNELRPVFENGKLLIDESLDTIRERISY